MASTLPDAADAFYSAGNQMLAGDRSGFEAICSEADHISHLGPIGAPARSGRLRTLIHPGLIAGVHVTRASRGGCGLEIMQELLFR